jgi:hypothetical protein
MTTHRQMIHLLQACMIPFLILTFVPLDLRQTLVPVQFCNDALLLWAPILIPMCVPVRASHNPCVGWGMG